MEKGICLALGFFDSIHYGHRKIIELLKKRAKQLNLTAVVSTFSDGFCMEIGMTRALIYTFEERKKILNSLGIEEILLFEFSQKFKTQSPQEFLQYLKNKHNPKYIICGYDYRFGFAGSGDVQTLQEYCYINGIELEVVPKVCKNGERVSSSLIKGLLVEGEIERANLLLSSNYSITNKVIRGRGEGKLNGCPTANIDLPSIKLMPRSGVYCTKTEFNGRLYHSVTNVGIKPTYNDFGYGIETRIADFFEDIYGQEIKVIFYKYLRSIRKFNTKEELIRQINEDLASK